MRLFLISQTENNGYDSYDSAVVCAADEESARQIHPGAPHEKWGEGYSSWCSSSDKVSAQLIGDAVDGLPSGIVLGSFNAG